MKILIADTFPENARNALSAAGFTVTFNEKLNGAELAAAMADHAVLVVRSTKVDKAVIDAGKALKLVLRAGAGYNTIDTAYAKEKGVAVCNCPGTNSIAVAELAVGLMLALDRRIADNVADSRAGKWNKKKYGVAQGIKGGKLTVIGAGAIGRGVIARALAFEMEVTAYDPIVTKNEIEATGAKYAGAVLDAVRDADVVSLHVPATPETKGMCGKAFFDALKPGALFINTSRADVVDEAALLDALQTKNLRAGLDVIAGEPEGGAADFDSVLAKHPNVYMTHHIGASTEQAQTAVSDLAVEIIKTYREKGEFRHRVN